MQPVSLYPGRAAGSRVRVDTSSAYDGFGWSSTVPAEGQVDYYSPVGFGGQHGYYWDYTGLYLLTHRYYDAGAGRFVTRDPIGYKGGLNLYGFAGNNPVNRRDPSGLTDLDDLFRAIDQKGQALQDSLRAGGQRIVNGVAELAEDLADSNSPDIRPDFPSDPSTYAPGDFGYEPRPSTVTNRNGYRAANGKFATPGGTERAGEPQADAVAESILRKRGFRVVGREVTVRANGLERRYDIVVRARSGNLIGVEVKSGTARLTASQRAFDQALNRSGRATVQAVGAYKGLTIRRAIVIRRP